MCKLCTSAKGSDNLSIGFDRSRDRGKRELTNRKYVKGKYHLRILLKVSFWICGTPRKNYMWFTL